MKNGGRDQTKLPTITHEITLYLKFNFDPPSCRCQDNVKIFAAKILRNKGVARSFAPPYHPIVRTMTAEEYTKTLGLGKWDVAISISILYNCFD